MIDCQQFITYLQAQKIQFFTGVPDSLLKQIAACITDICDKHIIAANEGNALALATGYHLATDEIPLVYMQNSGLGNIVNPLMSLTDPEVYSIPALILIGWRGEPGVKDEPQHVKQGRVTQTLLDALDVPSAVLPATWEEAQAVIDEAITVARTQKKPFALLVQKDCFANYKTTSKTALAQAELTREQALATVAETIPLDGQHFILSTTGKLSRELYEYRDHHDQGHGFDFLNVGSMGHVSQIALGVSIAKPTSTIHCFDGDGAFLMHMGGAAIIGQYAGEHFKHIVFNNGAHDSVGGQPTIAPHLDLPTLAKACGYKQAWRAETLAELNTSLTQFHQSKGPVFLEICVKKGARGDLGRPKKTPIENKQHFMKNLSL